MDKAREKRLARQRRHARVRQQVSGTAERPRLCVFRSLRHIHAQIIDDTRGHTLVSASTVDPEVRGQVDEKDKRAQAALVGEVLAKRALEEGIKQVVFDRAGYVYHGRVKSLADAARFAKLCREAGLRVGYGFEAREKYGADVDQFIADADAVRKALPAK